MSSSMPRSHKELDELVNNDPLVSGLQTEGNLGRLEQGLLLTLIVEHSDGRLNPRYKDLRASVKFLHENPNLHEKLNDAWARKSYKSIRDLDILRFDLDQRDAITDAWEVPYSGASHRLLLDNINAMNRTERHTNYGTIIQSSGSGKSRMVDELAKEVFTLPFNIRTIEGVVAFPPDEKIRNFLLGSSGSISLCQFRFALFFHHLFADTANKLESIIERSSSRESGEHVALAWREWLKTERESFYEAVVRKSISDGNKCSNTPDNTSVNEASEMAMESLKFLLGVLNPHSLSSELEEPSSVQLVLYFDEAHVLNKPADKSFTLLEILYSVISDFCEFPLFAIFLSTHSSLTTFSPPPSGPCSISERARDISHKFQAPITELPFDCCPQLPVVPGMLKLSDLSTVDFLAKWGRPLWWSLQAVRTSTHATSNLIDFARTKLICDQDVNVGYKRVDVSVHLAIIDVILMLDYEPRHQPSHAMQLDMVASHMRMMYSVPKCRGSFWSGYPSEPILAEAAMQQLHEFQTQADVAATEWTPAVNFMVKVLRDNLNSGLLDRGHRGALVMRCLLIQAYMRAVVEEHDRPNFSQGCKLVTFIQQLFADKYAAEILDSRPDNVKSDIPFKTRFKDAVVRFTHFVKAVDNTAPTTPAVFAAFVRGMAFVCHDQQSNVDLVIPVLLNEHVLLEESAMSAILVQVKMRTIAKGVDLREEDVGLFYYENTNDVRPYITIIAELGETSSPVPAAEKTTIVLPLPKTPSSPSIQSDSQPHPRYSLTAYGCSDRVYKVIQPTDMSIYYNLLGTSHSLGDHARGDERSLSAVRRMKPFWSVGSDCYHWIDDSKLQDSKSEAMEDQVLVGSYDDASE